MNPFPNNFPFNNQMNMCNNNLFPNIMNNQFQMLQMNQINQIMQMNQINQMMLQNHMNNQYQNNFVINPNQKFLVDKIIKFYQESGKNTYMNYNEPNQIRQLLNNLDTNSPLLKEGNDITDPFPYIHEKKKLIRFINHDFKIFNVKVPISFDKKALYDVAHLYKVSFGSKILLIYMNCILNKDEGSIDCISDGDFVVIIEDIYYLDHTYFNQINNMNFNGAKINVSLRLHGSIQTLVVPSNTKFSQLYKALILHFGSDYRFLFNSNIIKEKDDDRIIRDGSIIECYEQWEDISGYTYKFGKIINIKINFKDSKGKTMKISSWKLEVGIFDSIQRFKGYIEKQTGFGVKCFYLKEKKINFEEDKSFASLGIKEDCEIQIILN